MKYILVTGGVISGVGKGVIASSFGTLLKSCGLDVTSIKIDPYINIDAGTFSPYEHGEFSRGLPIILYGVYSMSCFRHSKNVWSFILAIFQYFAHLCECECAASVSMCIYCCKTLVVVKATRLVITTWCEVTEKERAVWRSPAKIKNLSKNKRLITNK